MDDPLCRLRDTSAARVLYFSQLVRLFSTFLVFVGFSGGGRIVRCQRLRKRSQSSAAAKTYNLAFARKRILTKNCEMRTKKHRQGGGGGSLQLPTNFLQPPAEKQNKNALLLPLTLTVYPFRWWGLVTTQPRFPRYLRKII